MPRAFFLVPTEDPVAGESFRGLTRAERIGRIRLALADLGSAIAGRLEGWDLEYLDGVGGWTIRRGLPAERNDVFRLLGDLPVAVATDDTFTTL